MIKMHVEGIGWDAVYVTRFVQERDQWWALVNAYHKKEGISWPTDRLSSSHEGLCFVVSLSLWIRKRVADRHCTNTVVMWSLLRLRKHVYEVIYIWRAFMTWTHVLRQCMSLHMFHLRNCPVSVDFCTGHTTSVWVQHITYFTWS
jgi:hypothetical protein